MLHTISKGVGVPDGLAFDERGNLYVANANPSGGTVTVYNSRLSLVRTISQGISNPVALAFDGRGFLTVANFSGSVTQYAPGSKKIARKISMGINSPIGLAFGP